ncbi:MAG TPA: DLW-39 family protein [Jatrophihabitantaceae bacterium]|nr:DLW-39 family protein [Jatrophihabitantaceae bacterium]
MRKTVLLLVGLGAAAAATLRRRKAHDNAALWHEATADTPR